MDDLTRDIRTMIETARQEGEPRTDKRSGMKYTAVICQNVHLGFSYAIRIPDPHFDQPPVAFERKYGHAGLAQKYRLPRGLSAANLQTCLLLLANHPGPLTPEQRVEKMEDLWDAVRTRNPALKTIVYDEQEPDTLFHILMGVASAFRVADIQHFIDDTSGAAAAAAEKTSAYKKMTRAFNRAAKAKERAAPFDRPLDMQWVGAPETLKQIKKQFKAQRKATRNPNP